MSETIRDVVIRISLQQKDVKLKAPDITDVKKTIEEASKQTASGVAKMADGAAKSVVDNFNRVFSGSDADKLADKALRNIDKQVESRMRDFYRKQSEAVRENERTIRAQERSYVQLGTNLSRTSEGILHLTKGIVELGLSGEDNLQKLAQRFVLLSGIIDTMRGGVQVVTGLSGALKSLAVVGGVGATAGIGAIAGLATVAIGGPIYQYHKDKREAEARELQRVVGEQRTKVSAAAREDADRTTYRFSGLRNAQSTRDAIAAANAIEGPKSIEELQDQIRRIEESRFGLRERGQEIRVGFNGNVAIAPIQRLKFASTLNFPDTFTANEQLNKNLLRGELPRPALSSAEQGRDALSTYQQVAEARRTEVRLLEEKLSTQNKIFDLQTSEIEKAQKLLDLRKSQNDLERQRLTDANAAVGALDKGQLVELKNLRKKFEGGKATQEDESRLRQLLPIGEVADFIGARQAARGRERGGAEIVGNIIGKPFAGEEALVADRAGIVAQDADLAKRLQDVVSSRKETIEKTVEAMKIAVKNEQEVLGVINTITNSLKTLEAAVARAKEKVEELEKNAGVAAANAR